ncbi:hypothetical protein P170DRAFT_18357 [Aspergillus steynii IBT 23096]|uniref:Uncharacterized protein n=1 Tax=Aspergillus steynii IBT 23096 TaxID=1392250 RepID=A0A2I2GNH2_9EURO|nr:uncharacterized protein P170DRAFT_18357 [Aspergillus steynii IBT 23096]PLB54427.1 hypothetical protein P170DRAFT_18357 [Aspergillus steynii IBT 23096]
MFFFFFSFFLFFPSSLCLSLIYFTFSSVSVPLRNQGSNCKNTTHDDDESGTSRNMESSASSPYGNPIPEGNAIISPRDCKAPGQKRKTSTSQGTEDMQPDFHVPHLEWVPASDSQQSPALSSLTRRQCWSSGFH